MVEYAIIERLRRDVEKAIRPNVFLQWLASHQDEEEYTEILYTVNELLYGTEEEIMIEMLENYDYENELDEDDPNYDDKMWERAGLECNHDHIGFYQDDEYVVAWNSTKDELIFSVHLPEWIIDLDKLAMFQRNVMGRPLFFWQVREYLFYRWGLEDENSFPMPGMDHWTD